MEHHDPRKQRPLAYRLIALLERAGPLTLAEIANRLTMGDEKPSLLEALASLREDWVTEVVVKGRYATRPQRVWAVIGDSRLRRLEPLPRVSYRGPETLAALQEAVYRRLTSRRRGRGAG